MGELYTNPLFGDANCQFNARMEGNSTDSKAALAGTDTVISYGTAYGKYNQGALFTASSSSKILYGDNLNETTGAFSVGSWIKAVTLPIFAVVVGKGGSAHAGFFLNTDNNGFVNLAIPNQNLTTSGADIISTGSWFHIAGVREVSGGNQTGKVYINGTLRLTGATVAVATASNTDNFSLGCRNDSGNNDGFFDGSIDDAFKFNRALNATEVYSLYAATGGMLGIL